MIRAHAGMSVPSAVISAVTLDAIITVAPTGGIDPLFHAVASLMSVIAPPAPPLKMSSLAPTVSVLPDSATFTPTASRSALIFARSVASGVVTIVSPSENAAPLSTNVPFATLPPTAIPPMERPGAPIVIVPAFEMHSSVMSAFGNVNDWPAATLSVPMAVRVFAENVVVPP